MKRHPNDEKAQCLTYRQCQEYIRDLATEMIAMGMRDKTVAIVGENSPEWIFTYFSSLSIGAIAVPIDKEMPLGYTVNAFI